MELQQSLKDAFELMNKFRGDIIYSNRFFIEDMKLFEYIDKIIEQNTVVLENEKIFYRARTYKNDEHYLSRIEQLERVSNQKNGFYGYNKEHSSAPKFGQAKSGRANPDLISYLYIAEREYTALAEIRPFLNLKISIAEIKLLKELKVVDFSSYNYNENMDFVQALKFVLSWNFASPIDSDEKYRYIPTQYIAEYVKKKELDGIRYRSSLDEYGINVVLFNPDNAEAISSRLYEVQHLDYEAKSVDTGENRKLGSMRYSLLPTLGNVKK